MKQHFIKWFNFLFARTSKVLSPEPKPQMAYETVRHFLGKVPNINLGGCGISALVLFDHARAAGLEPKIIFGYIPWAGGFDENQEYKRGIRPHAESAAHIFISIGDKDHDSEGEYEREGHWKFDSQITREHLVNAIRHGGWNPCFEREKWLPKIEQFIGYKLI